jgi:hypothetical protein
MTIALCPAGVSQCQLPIDRVRGLLGLAQDAHEVGITAEDWSDVVVVYTKFSRYLLGSTELYKIVPSHEWWRWMSLAFTLVRQADLPSWVPDFNQQDLALNYDFRYGQMWYTNFSGKHGSIQNGASAKENKGVVPGERWNELILKGKMVDEVLAVYHEIPRPLPEASIHQEIHRLYCVAHWEVELANAVLSGRGPVDHKPHRPVPLDTYWLTLRGGSLCHLPDGGLTLESHQRYHETATRMNDVAQKHGISTGMQKYRIVWMSTAIVYLCNQQRLQRYPTVRYGTLRGDGDPLGRWPLPRQHVVDPQQINGRASIKTAVCDQSREVWLYEKRSAAERRGCCLQSRAYATCSEKGATRGRRAGEMANRRRCIYS